jgi:membrane-bound inhibitor of C-type lysozyme
VFKKIAFFLCVSGCVFVSAVQTVDCSESGASSAVFNKYLRSAVDGKTKFVCIWMPLEILTEAATEQEKDSINEAVKNCGDVSIFAALYLTDKDNSIDFMPDDKVISKIKLIDAQGNKYKTIKKNKYGAGLDALLTGSKQAMVQKDNSIYMRNIVFLVFPNQDKHGAKIIDPAQNGKFTVEL